MLPLRFRNKRELTREARLRSASVRGTRSGSIDAPTTGGHGWYHTPSINTRDEVVAMVIDEA